MSFEFDARAGRDLRQLDKPERRRILDALEGLDDDAANLDIRALEGRAGWLRLRSGDYRILYRAGGGGWRVARIVNHRDLERAVAGLTN